MVETLLLREYSEDDVVVCYADQLERFVGPETQVLAIHAHNPLGISYATDVYSKRAEVQHGILAWKEWNDDSEVFSGRADLLWPAWEETFWAWD